MQMMTVGPLPPRQTARDASSFLETLCFWRALYGRRGPQDRIQLATVEEAVAAAELRMRMRRVRDESLLRRYISR